MLAGLPTSTLVLWGSATLLTLAVLTVLILSHRFLEYKFFVGYLLVNLLQTAIGIAAYRGYGFEHTLSYVVGWTTQGAVVLVRALAVTQICYLILGKYKGIWALAARILGLAGGIVFLSAIYFGRSDYFRGIITLEVSLEACIATGVVGLFLFARYYHVPVEPVAGLLGLGLGLLSCFKILNDLILERFAHIYGFAWNNASSAIFVFALGIWVWAVAKPIAVAIPEPKLLTPQLYAQAMPQVNERLASLNEQLTRLLQVRSPNS